MAKRKKKTPVRRSSFVFKDVTFYEDPCEEFKLMYAMAGGVGIGGIKKPVVIMGPADVVRQIKTALRNA
jgi:hypothetical protein